MTHKYQTKVCWICGKEYTPTSSKQRYCLDCGVEVERKIGIEWAKTHRKERCESSHKWDASHPEYGTTYRVEHQEEEHERGIQWDLNHPGAHTKRGKKWNAKRRSLGFIPLNEWFPGCEGHHMNKWYVYYIPYWLHRSVWHNQWTGQGMKEINAKVIYWLLKSKTNFKNGGLFWPQ